MRGSCSQCGARGATDDTCAARFSELLALDHSRREPWGSRHGLAFAAYALQHPAGRPQDILERCWLMLYRVYVSGDDRLRVARALRAQRPHQREEWDIPPFPDRHGPLAPFTTTIVDLGSFEADVYPARLDTWCRSTLTGIAGIEAFSSPARLLPPRRTVPPSTAPPA